MSPSLAEFARVVRRMMASMSNRRGGRLPQSRALRGMVGGVESLLWPR
jgi:hypothetical protein